LCCMYGFVICVWLCCMYGRVVCVVVLYVLFCCMCGCVECGLVSYVKLCRMFGCVVCAPFIRSLKNMTQLGAHTNRLYNSCCGYLLFKSLKILSRNTCYKFGLNKVLINSWTI
jgi:hypothetical protein